MNTFRVTKLITVSDLAELVQAINAVDGNFIERETRTDEDHWLLCVACTDRSQANAIRCWTSRNPASGRVIEEVGSEDER